jgi:uncharacterized integral membrane protein
MKVSTLIAWSIIAVLTLFIFINWHATSINFLWVARVEMPLSLALIFAAAMGFAAATLFRMVKKEKKS